MLTWWLAALVGVAGCSSKPKSPLTSGADGSGANGNANSDGFIVEGNGALPSGTDGADKAPLGAQCLGETRQAEAIGLDIFVMLDISASMLEVLPQARALVPPTKWDAVRQSLQTFVQAPQTADIGVGLQYFPQVHADTPFSCTSSDECGAGGPCRNSLCVVNATVDQPGNLPTLRFLTLPPSANPEEPPAYCSTNADCTGPGESCRVIEGECVVPPSAADPDGAYLDLDPDPNGFAVALCNGAADCAGLPGTGCDRIGRCQGQNAGCTLTLGCGGVGACVDIPYDCVNQTRCEPAVYASPAVEISSDPARSPAIVASLQSQVPNGLTPTGPALSGALEHARAWAEQHPGRQVVTVLATDGFATECAPVEIPDIAQIASDAATGQNPVRTFVIGVFGQADLGANGQARLNTLAQAGGTERAFVVNTAGNVATDFLNALNVIRDTAVSCEFQLDASGALDFDQVNLQVTDAAGTQKQLYNVGDVSACGFDDEGWYYVRDSEGNPLQINVCPSTCGTFMAGGVRADLQIGCATLIR